MKKIIFLGLFFWALGTQAQHLKLDRQHSIARFEVKNAGLWVEGNFSIPEVKMSFDENDLKNSFIEAEIEVGSLNTDNKSRDKHLLEEEYFYAARYPTIYFKSQKIEKVSAHKFMVTVDLRIKDITKSLQIPLNLRNEGNKKIFTTSFMIDRLDFGVGKSSWILGDHVKINLLGIFTIEP